MAARFNKRAKNVQEFIREMTKYKKDGLIYRVDYSRVFGIHKFNNLGILCWVHD